MENLPSYPSKRNSQLWFILFILLYIYFDNASFPSFESSTTQIFPGQVLEPFYLKKCSIPDGERNIDVMNNAYTQWIKVMNKLQEIEEHIDYSKKYGGLLSTVQHKPFRASPLYARGLLAIPIGNTNTPYLNILIPYFLLGQLKGLQTLSPGSKFTINSILNNNIPIDIWQQDRIIGPFDIILFAYDETNWYEYSWAHSLRVTIIADTGGKFSYARRYLHPDNLTQYSHIFLWDDDLVPSTTMFMKEKLQTNEDLSVSSTFNPIYILRLLQYFPMIQIAQPFINEGCHYACDAGDTIHTTEDGRSFSPTYLASKTHAFSFPVEIMVPIIHHELYRCVYNHLYEEFPRGWGIETVITCVCNIKIYNQSIPDSIQLTQFRLDHMNTKGLATQTVKESVNYGMENKFSIFSEEWAINGWNILQNYILSLDHGKDCIENATKIVETVPPEYAYCFSVAGSE